MTVSRRSRRDQGPCVSLFPFLAVLLCTMGMLIMLLVLIGRDTADRETAETAAASEKDPLFSRSAFAELAERAELASKKTEQKPNEVSESLLNTTPLSEKTDNTQETQKLSPEDEQLYEEYLRLYGEMTPEEIKSQRESAEWFLSELEGVRDRTRDELKALRKKLSEADAEIARQVEQLIELNARAAALNGEGNENDAETLQTEIDKKAEEIAELNTQIEELRKKAEASGQKPTYAILPYRGKSGTFRRPIYVECDGNGIRLMPERVQFIPEDFLVAKYPGNPFDAGLRAARQYYIEKGEGNDENEPYPLLILKPESAQQYYIAKEALASWGGEFGYEFVESDADIEYPKPDPKLKRLVEEQVEMARVRVAGPVAAILNELEAKGINTQFAEDELGGGLGSGSENGLGSGLGNGTGSVSGETGNEFASQLGPYVKLNGSGYGEESRENTAVPFNSGMEGASSESYSPALASGSYASQNENGDFDGFSDFDNSEILPDTAADSPFSGLTSSASEGGTASEAAAESAGRESTYAQGAVPYSAEENGTAASLFAQMTPQAKGETQDGEPQIDPRETVGNTTYLAGSDGSMTEAPEGAEQIPVSEQKKGKDNPEKKEPKVKTEHDKRAINLAEELRKPSQMAIERPVTVICKPDGFLFPAQPGIRNAKLVSENDQEILETIISCVRSWKVAGKNMYWSPWIKLKVNPGGEANSERFIQLMRSQNVRVDQVRE